MKKDMKIALTQTKPVIEIFHKWLIEEKKRTLPKSALGKAIFYSLKSMGKINFIFR